jgi:predicted hydrocarbon binding protein
MHGIILTELHKFVEQRYGAEAWTEILKRAGLDNPIYLLSTTYPDSDVVAIVGAASKMSGMPAADLMQAFGEALVPGLIHVYGRQVKRGWRTLDLIEHTEGAMHTVVRRQNPGAAPPRLQCSRVTPREVVVTYSSQRKMCAVAKGIVRGIADHFQERIVIRESECMLKGASACKISVRLA